MKFMDLKQSNKFKIVRHGVWWQCRKNRYVIGDKNSSSNLIVNGLRIYRRSLTLCNAEPDHILWLSVYRLKCIENGKRCTNDVPERFLNKKGSQWKSLKALLNMVPRNRIELLTRGFSVPFVSKLIFLWFQTLNW